MTPLEELDKFLKEFEVELQGHVALKGRRAYLVPDEVLQLSQELNSDYFSIGLPLGEASPNGFMPSLALLDLMKKTHRYLTITDEGEWLFVCRRDVFEENVREKGDTSRRYLVMNNRKEVLGLGKWTKEGSKRFVTPLLDRGDFLRREEKRKKKR